MNHSLVMTHPTRARLGPIFFSGWIEARGFFFSIPKAHVSCLGVSTRARVHLVGV